MEMLSSLISFYKENMKVMIHHFHVFYALKKSNRKTLFDFDVHVVLVFNLLYNGYQSPY